MGAGVLVRPQVPTLCPAQCPRLVLLTQETGSCPCRAGLEPTAEVFTPTLGDEVLSLEGGNTAVPRTES